MGDDRLQCRFCGVRTWMRDYNAFMRDHDRPDGRKCRRAARESEGRTEVRLRPMPVDVCGPGSDAPPPPSNEEPKQEATPATLLQEPGAATFEQAVAIREARMKARDEQSWARWAVDAALSNARLHPQQCPLCQHLRAGAKFGDPPRCDKGRTNLLGDCRDHTPHGAGVVPADPNPPTAPHTDDRSSVNYDPRDPPVADSPDPDLVRAYEHHVAYSRRIGEPPMTLEAYEAVTRPTKWAEHSIRPSWWHAGTRADVAKRTGQAVALAVLASGDGTVPIKRIEIDRRCITFEVRADGPAAPLADLERGIEALGAATVPQAVRDKLAEYAHEAWSGWMRYLFDKSTPDAGCTIIPSDLTTRWRRQASTPFNKLPPEERRSDYTEADHMLAIMAEHGRGDGRWALIRATSPSGKRQFVCTGCGRVSTTPEHDIAPRGPRTNTEHAAAMGDTRTCRCAEGVAMPH